MGNESCNPKACQQSVHLTGGILRHFRAFSTPEQNPALKVLFTPAHPQVTQTVGWLRAKQRGVLHILWILGLIELVKFKLIFSGKNSFQRKIQSAINQVAF